MDTADLLAKNNITRALIVDDGYDDVPRISDLGATKRDWDTFLDDLQPRDVDVLKDAYQSFDPNTDEDYSRNQTFLNIVWNLRAQLNNEATNHIFASYDSNQREMICDLARAKQCLEELGLEVTTAGRNFVQAALQSDLILIDLYLGSLHDPDDMRLSIEGLRSAVAKRKNNPPVIILMSSGSNVLDKRSEFRDKANIYASGFRVVKKADIVQKGRIDQLLFELALHRQDSLKLTNFLETWRDGIKNAIESTSVDVRRLDLEDIKQLQDLLLKDEQALGGSYFLNLVDRLLLHAIEADKPTICAAKKLNVMSSDEYPPNTITGDKSNLNLVYKTIYAHPNRRELDIQFGYPVGFGDIIALAKDVKPPRGSIFYGAKGKGRNAVFVVMTPACDLVRNPPAAKRVLLLEGERKSLDAVAYSPPLPRDNHPRTIVVVCEGDRFGVEWKTKKLATLTKAGIEKLLAKEGVIIAGRLRSEYAFELQQTLLSGLGRVGNMAPMPANYPVVATVYYPNNNGSLVQLGIKLNGICVVGRINDKEKSRIGFDSSQRNDFADKVREKLNDVHRNSRSMVRKCFLTEYVSTFFTMGFEFDIKRASLKTVECKLKFGTKTQKVGTVVYNKEAEQAIKNLGVIQSAGLIFEIKESEEPI